MGKAGAREGSEEAAVETQVLIMLSNREVGWGGMKNDRLSASTPLGTQLSYIHVLFFLGRHIELALLPVQLTSFHSPPQDCTRTSHRAPTTAHHQTLSSIGMGRMSGF